MMTKRFLLFLALLAACCAGADAQISGAGQLGCSGAPVSGTAWNSSTALNSTQQLLTNGAATALLVELDQTTTITGGAVTFQASGDGSGGTYAALPVAQIINPSTGAQLTNPYTLVASTNQQFLVILAAGSNLQLKLTTALTGTGSVTPFVTVLCTLPTLPAFLDAAGNLLTKVNAALPSGGNTIGAVTQASGPWTMNLTQVAGSALGAPSNYGTSPGAVAVIGVNAFVTNTPSVAQSGTWTVQPGNTANTTPWLFTINQGGNSATVSAGGALKVDGSAVTQPVSGTITANIGTTNGLALDTSVNGLLLAQASSTSGQKGPLAQCAVTTSAPTYTTAQTDPLSCDTAGNLRVNIGSPTVTANAGTGTFNIQANASVNVNQVAGSAVSTAAAGTMLVGVADGAGNKLTTNSTTTASKFALDQNIISILGTAPTTAGFLDVKGADGNVFVRQATAANLNATAVQGNAGSNAQAWWARIGDATNGPVAVKAASTASVAADPSLVVAFSPNSPLPAGSATIGAVTQASGPWSTNQTQLNSVALGSPSAYGTAPGAVNVAGVNAFVTNAVNATATGNVASGSADSGNPVKIGCVYNNPIYNNAWQNDPLILQNGQRADCQVDSFGRILVVDPQTSVLLNQLLQLNARATPSNSAFIRGSLGRTISSTGDALDVNVKYPESTNDPCSGPGVTNLPISTTASVVLVRGVGGARIRFCNLFLMSTAAESVSVVEGTGPLCGTGTAAVIGSTTAANGPDFAANQGLTYGNGLGSVAEEATAGNDVCLLLSGSTKVAGNLRWVFR